MFLVYLMLLVFEMDRVDMWSYFVIEVDLRLVFLRNLWKMYEMVSLLEIIFDKFDKLNVMDFKKKLDKSFCIIVVVVNFI